MRTGLVKRTYSIFYIFTSYKQHLQLVTKIESKYEISNIDKNLTNFILFCECCQHFLKSSTFDVNFLSTYTTALHNNI
jgi:hypothetical protein